MKACLECQQTVHVEMRRASHADRFMEQRHGERCEKGGSREREMREHEESFSEHVRKRERQALGER